MRTLEIRRHSLRKTGGGSQLSQVGVDLARRLGAAAGPFARVAASVAPRTRETALAMGFAVDEELVVLTDHGAAAQAFERHRWWEAPAPFAALADLVRREPAARAHATAYAAAWRDLVLQVPDGAAALVIGHSGDLESGLVACLPNGDHHTWGGQFGCLEGARLTFDGDPPWFTGAAILRVGHGGADGRPL